MKFEIVPKHTLEKISSDLITDCIIISIHSADVNEPNIAANEHIKNVLFLCFDDVVKGEKNFIDQPQAKLINRFVNEYASLPLCIVSCDAGISRSAGVAAALSLIHNGSDEEIFSDPKFCPNMDVYRAILNSSSLVIDESEIAAKEALNIQAWKDAGKFD